MKQALKVHLVWVPKYRKRVLTGAVAVRARDLLWQIAAENDLQIISGKVAADLVLNGRSDLIDAAQLSVERFKEGKLLEETAVL